VCDSRAQAIPETESPHVEVELPGGNRLLFDTEEVIAGVHPGSTPPTSPGRVVLAFGLPAPADVDALFSRLTDAGHPGVLKPMAARDSNLRLGCTRISQLRCEQPAKPLCCR
jgi:hypothetical protein